MNLFFAAESRPQTPQGDPAHRPDNEDGRRCYCGRGGSGCCSGRHRQRQQQRQWHRRHPPFAADCPCRAAADVPAQRGCRRCRGRRSALPGPAPVAHAGGLRGGRGRAPAAAAAGGTAVVADVRRLPADVPARTDGGRGVFPSAAPAVVVLPRPDGPDPAETYANPGREGLN